MHPRHRLWFLLAPLLALKKAGAQPNVNAPTGGPGRESGGEVQVGAGTQGDVTTGSSGAKADAKSDAKSDRKSDAPGLERSNAAAGNRPASGADSARSQRDGAGGPPSTPGGAR